MTRWTYGAVLFTPKKTIPVLMSFALAERVVANTYVVKQVKIQNVSRSSATTV